MKLKAPETVFSSAGFCPGCGHGLATRLIGEVSEELGIQEKMLAVVDVACCSFNIDYWRYDTIMAAHGRDIPTAVGVKHIRPANPVFAYLGDGAAYSIGMAETIHAALRNDNICVFVVNNSVFGMTGGQMAPTTLVGQKTTTSPYGRDEDWCGAPLKVSEMLAEVPCSYYIERVAVNNTPNIVKAKKAISKAFHYQMEGKGFTLVEVLSACPTNWGLSPIKAMEWLEENMIPYYPLGVKKDKGAE
mgnify:FL=1